MANPVNEAGSNQRLSKLDGVTLHGTGPWLRPHLSMEILVLSNTIALLSS